MGISRPALVLALLLLLEHGLAASAAQHSSKVVDFSPLIELPTQALQSKEKCEPNYGFLPCSDGIAGNLFLLVVYGFLLLKAAQFLLAFAFCNTSLPISARIEDYISRLTLVEKIHLLGSDGLVTIGVPRLGVPPVTWWNEALHGVSSEGSEMLLVVLNPGLVGGLLLPILGALPDALLILVSGLFASEAEVMSQVLVGMGLLAGSTIMLLTLLWSTSLIVGRCDLDESSQTAKDKTLTRKVDVKNTGVTTDIQTQYSAWIMILTVIPYILAQVPRIIRKPKLGHTFVLISCVLAFAGLVAYCTYQVVSPWIQQRRISLARQRFRLYHTLHRVSLMAKERSWGNLVLPSGELNDEALHQLFSYFDEDKSGHLKRSELKALIVGLGIGHKSFLPEEEEVERWMKDFDVSHDGEISEGEFRDGFVRWLKDIAKKAKSANSATKSGNWDEEAQDARTSLQALMNEGGNEEEDEEEEETQGLTKKQIIIRAVGFIILGAAIAGVFADPLVDAIENFSTATGIPSFFIAFVATPMATNSSEAISSILFASKKKKQNISLTYSQIYGGVTMNNTLCLGIFLAVVAYRGLTWDFSSEVLVITLVTLIMGVIAGTRTTFNTWFSGIALALYPLAILIVAFLDYVLGWQ